MLNGEGTDEEERNMRFSFSTPKEITDLIRFMMKEAENLMKGSVHEDDFFIVHDALVLMTAKETIK